MDKEKILRDMWEIFVRTFHQLYPDKTSVCAVSVYFSDKTMCKVFSTDDGDDVEWEINRIKERG